jgi:serpin B
MPEAFASGIFICLVPANLLFLNAKGGTMYKLLFALLFIAPQGFAADVVSSTDSAKIVNNAAAKLFVQLAKPGENLVFSPYSLAVAMGMAYEGARGETAAQIAKVMGFGTQEETRAGFQNIVQQLATDSGENKFLTANAFWAQENYHFLPEYTGNLKTGYGAEAHNFSGNPAAEINKWVEEATMGRIPKIISSSSVDKNTLLMLINATYFKGKWKDEFKNERTKPAFFRMCTGDGYLTPMMHQISSGDYADKGTYRVLKKDYTGHQFSMVILLPKSDDGLTSLEVLLSTTGFDPMISELKSRMINLFLPRFAIDSNLDDMRPLVKSLGIQNAFGPDANFTGVSKRNDIYINLFRQMANIKINEQGTEAAAATNASMIMGITVDDNPDRPVPFRADHPFIYILRHNPSGTILFAGEYGKKKLKVYKTGELSKEEMNKATKSRENSDEQIKMQNIMLESCDKCLAGITPDLCSKFIDDITMNFSNKATA